MKISRKESSRTKKVALIALSILLVALAIIAILEKTGVINLFNTQPTLTSGPSKQELDEQEKVNDAKKQDFIEKTKEPTPTAPPQSNDSLTLTASQADATVTVLTKLKGFSSGVCELKITNGVTSHTATAEVIYQPEFSSCAGFGIPVSQLGTGTWSITLNATPTGGSVLTTSINLEVK